MINEHLEELIPPHCCDSLKKYILNGVSPLLEGKPIGIINRIATLNPSFGICARIPIFANELQQVTSMEHYENAQPITLRPVGRGPSLRHGLAKPITHA